MTLPIIRTVTAMLLRCGRQALGLSGVAHAAQEAGSAKIAVGDEAASYELKASCVSSGDLKVCARCRHWIPVYSTPVDDWEEPGGCFGLTGKWQRWNGMWTKASDGCENWQLSPLRSGIKLRFPIDSSYEAMWSEVTPDNLIPF